MKTKLLLVGMICLALMFSLPANSTMSIEGEMNTCIANCFTSAKDACIGLKGELRAQCNVDMKEKCANECACAACGCDNLKITDLQHFQLEYADLVDFTAGMYADASLVGQNAANLAGVDVVRNADGLVQVNIVKRMALYDDLLGEWNVVENSASFIISLDPGLAHILLEDNGDIMFVNAAYMPVQLNWASVIDLFEFIGFPKVIAIYDPNGNVIGINFYETLRYAVQNLDDGKFLVLTSNVFNIMANLPALAFAGFNGGVFLVYDNATGQIVPASYAEAMRMVLILSSRILMPEEPEEPPVVCRHKECLDTKAKVCIKACELCMDNGDIWDPPNDPLGKCIPSSVPCEFSECYTRDKVKVACDDLLAYCEKFFPEGCDPNAKIEAMAAGVIILPVCPW